MLNAPEEEMAVVSLLNFFRKHENCIPVQRKVFLQPLGMKTKEKKASGRLGVTMKKGQ